MIVLIFYLMLAMAASIIMLWVNWKLLLGEENEEMLRVRKSIRK